MLHALEVMFPAFDVMLPAHDVMLPTFGAYILMISAGDAGNVMS